MRDQVLVSRMDYDLIVVKTLERVYKNYYYIIRGEFLLALVKQFADEITGNCDSKYHKCTFQNNMSYHLSFPPFPSKPLFLLWISGNIQVLFQAARLSEQGQGSLKQSCTDIPDGNLPFPDAPAVHRLPIRYLRSMIQT